MKDVTLWLLGASIASLATASAFLLIAYLGSGSATSEPIPQISPSASKSPMSTPLVLRLPKDRLEGLQRGPGQKISLDVENGSSEEFPSVNLTLNVSSEDTAQPSTRYYWTTLEGLAPRETTTVEFEIDLSSPVPYEGRKSHSANEQVREILEVRATTPKGDSAFKTAVL